MARTMEHPSQLTALYVLANVCQAAESLPTTTKRELPPDPNATRTITPPPFYYAYPCASYYPPMPGYFTPAPPATAQENTPNFPTPPLTPERSSLSPQQPSHDVDSMICVKAYDAYLAEAWPVNNQKRGCGVVRAVLYDQIAAALRGEEVGSKIRHWVKESEFFLFHKGEGAGSTIAVPVVRGRGLQHRPIPGTYRLVARVEDFATIIAIYHNDSTGHPGIRKTYGRIQEDFAYLPRTAIAKFIELCKSCSGRKKTAGCHGNRPLSDVNHSC